MFAASLAPIESRFLFLWPHPRHARFQLGPLELALSDFSALTSAAR
jgi:hypothetical protein